MEPGNIVQSQRDFWCSGATQPVGFRIDALRKLRQAITDNEELLVQALSQDLGKSEFESYTTEIGVLINEIDYHISHLKRWMRPRRVRTPLFLWPSVGRIMYQPLGVILIIAPWNYPVQLTLNPLIGAISAGNCAVLKPSPSAPASALALEQIIRTSFPKEYVCTVPGDGQIVEALLAEKFDHIFYTGGPGFARRIMEAAAVHLTPVTLELGGKSPCIVDRSANVEVAARRIGWGKFLNAGQTCVAPDYVLVHRNIKEQFVESLQSAVTQFFGSEPRKSPDYPRMSSPGAVLRLAELAKTAGRVIFGGEFDAGERYFAPTALDVADLQCGLMQQEIFGPLLPIVEFEDLEQAVDIINERDKPLALYYFGRKEIAAKVLAATSSGGACVNDTIMHVAHNRLPFGGVGRSGTGRYHGRYSFEAFSNCRPVLTTPTSVDLPVRYAPYKWLGAIKHLF